MTDHFLESFWNLNEQSSQWWKRREIHLFESSLSFIRVSHSKPKPWWFISPWSRLRWGAISRLFIEHERRAQFRCRCHSETRYFFRSCDPDILGSSSFLALANASLCYFVSTAAKFLYPIVGDDRQGQGILIICIFLRSAVPKNSGLLTLCVWGFSSVLNYKMTTLLLIETHWDT